MLNSTKKLTLEEHERRAVMVDALNKSLEMLTYHYDEAFDDVMKLCLKPIAEAMSVDCVVFCRNMTIDGENALSQLYRWILRGDVLTDQSRYILPRDCISTDRLRTTMQDICVDKQLGNMSAEEIVFANQFGIKSFLIVPIFTQGIFWGAVIFEDHLHERHFDETCLDLYRSAAHVCVNAVMHNEARQEIQILETGIDSAICKVYSDPLTGIKNRRFFDENLKRVINTLSRIGGTLSLLMIDIDCFKKYNDTYGHIEGDACLKIIADTLTKNVLRPNDFVARYGGEEFAVVLPNTDKNGARGVADRFQASIRTCGIPHRKNRAANYVTVSIGGTTGTVDRTQNGADYVRQADEMLYLSKQNGGNRVSFAPLKKVE